MHTKTLWTGSLILTLCSACAVRAEDLPFVPGQDAAAPLLAGQGTPQQTTTTPPYGPPSEVLQPYGTPPTGPSGNDGVATPACLSSWIVHPYPFCSCGPLHGGPIGYEIYGRTGPTLPVGGGALSKVVSVGWMVEGGGRVLFFDPAGEAAWTVDLGVSSKFNHGGEGNQTFPFQNPQFADQKDLVSVRYLNRTGVNATFGREWYLAGSAFADGTNWRIGVDGGGRYQTGRLDLSDFLVGPGLIIPNGFESKTAINLGVLLAIHSDIECPLGGCKLQAGVRIEWDWTWQDYLHTVGNDMSDVNLLLTLGIRF